MVLPVSLLSLVSFLFVALSKSSFKTFDTNVSSWAISIQTSMFTPIAVMIDFAFSTPALLATTLLIAGFLFYKNYWKYSALLMGAMLGEALIVATIKISTQSIRPFDELTYERGFSFPSGHTAGSVVFWGLITYFAWKYWKSSKARISSSVLSILATSIVGFDRIYLNVHWFSDVLGGYLLGIFWLTFSILMFPYLERSMMWNQIAVRRGHRASGESLGGAAEKRFR